MSQGRLKCVLISAFLRIRLGGMCRSPRRSRGRESRQFRIELKTSEINRMGRVVSMQFPLSGLLSSFLIGGMGG